MSEHHDKVLLEKLSRSKIYKDYERAFRGATGLPLALTPAETWGLPLQDDPNENPFCSLMGRSKRGCTACLEMQQELSRKGSGDGITIGCFAGLCDTAVPVHLGEQLVGFLRTGQVRMRAPTEADFDAMSKKLIQWGVEFDAKELHDAYFASKVISSEQYQSMVRLLRVFAEHLSIVSNEVLVREENAESPLIARAKDFIEKNQGDDLSLGAVAKAVNASTFYFCKMFKKATGLTFTEYLGRVRVEKAKSYLINPHLRVSEVAFEVGFQSLSQFNRVFKRITGLSPTDYRTRQPQRGAPAAARRPAAAT